MRSFEGVERSEEVDPEVRFLREQLNRLEAEFTSYRRKVEREKGEWVKVASSERMVQFLDGFR